MRVLTITVTAARVKSYDMRPLIGWDSFIEDHDMGDCDPKTPVHRTFVLPIDSTTTNATTGATP